MEDLQRLADALSHMREDSRFALRAFLEAVEAGVSGVSLTVHAPGRRGGHVEICLEIDPRAG